MKTISLGWLLFFALFTSSAQAQWVPTAGPYGGTVYSLATAGTHIFAGTDIGIFRSTDSGASWINQTAGLGAISVSSFATVDTEVFAAAGTAVLRSTDNGQSWRSVGTGLNNSYLSFISGAGSELFVNTGYSYLGTSGGVFRSTDRGLSWSPIIGIPADTTVYSFAHIGGMFFAGTQVGLYRSTDSGASWMPTANSGINSSYIEALATIGDTIFAGTSNSVFYSTDFGDSWNPTADNGFSGVNTLVASGSTLYAGVGSGFYWSTDGGNTIRQPISGLPNVGVLAIAPLGSLLFVGTSMSGVYISKDGGLRWNSANTGLSIATIASAVTQGPRLFVSTSAGSLYYSEDSGTEWNDITSNMQSSPGGVTLLATNPADGALLGAAANGGVMVSFDSGQSWTLTNNGNIANALFAAGNYVFEGTDNGVFRSNDDGTTWIDASSGLPSSNLYILAFAQNGNTLYCATEYDGVFYSNDTGLSWNDISPSLPSTYDYTSTLAIMGNYLFLGTQSSGVMLSSDNGNSWSSDGLDGQDITSLLVIGNDIFAASSGSGLTGTAGGINFSTDHGTTWTDVSSGMPAGTPVTVLAAQEGNLYAGTTGIGVWRRPLTEIIADFGVSEQQPVPDRNSYPNPFTRSTTIPITLIRSGHVTVQILDVMGELVATLANQDIGAGTHEIVWNAASATPGVYECRIVTPDGEQTLSLVREQ